MGPIRTIINWLLPFGRIMKQFVIIILLMCTLLMSSCSENSQRIPINDVENIMCAEYAYENNTGLTYFEITDEMPWYADMERLCERVNRWSEKKLIPATYDREENGKLLVTSEEIMNSLIFQVKLPDTDPTDDVKEYHTINIVLWALTGNRVFLSRDDRLIRFTEVNEHTATTTEIGVIKDKIACEMIAELEKAMRVTASEMAESENQETEG